MIDYDSQIYLLSSKFKNDYPSAKYPELLYKSKRPYTCLLVETHYDYYIGIPFRSDIKHSNAYKFNPASSSRQNPGLDYTKIVIIQNDDYIDSTIPAVVDQNEYNELMKNLNKVENESVKYVETYVNHMKGIKIIHPREFSRKYTYSTLMYFHKELGISSCVLTSHIQ